MSSKWFGYRANTASAHSPSPITMPDPASTSWHALLTPIAVLTVDALDKRMRRERPFAPAPDRRDAASSSNG